MKENSDKIRKEIAALKAGMKVAEVTYLDAAMTMMIHSGRSGGDGGAISGTEECGGGEDGQRCCGENGLGIFIN